MNAGQNSLHTLRSNVLILCHNTRLIFPHSVTLSPPMTAASSGEGRSAVPLFWSMRD